MRNIIKLCLISFGFISFLTVYASKDDYNVSNFIQDLKNLNINLMPQSTIKNVYKVELDDRTLIGGEVYTYGTQSKQWCYFGVKEVSLVLMNSGDNLDLSKQHYAVAKTNTCNSQLNAVSDSLVLGLDFYSIKDFLTLHSDLLNWFELNKLESQLSQKYLTSKQLMSKNTPFYMVKRLSETSIKTSHSLEPLKKFIEIHWVINNGQLEPVNIGPPISIIVD